MKKHKNYTNNQAFTLIELIVVIAIMGVILILALPQVSKLQMANTNKKYDAYYSSIESAAKLYMDSHAKDLFGSNSSGCVTVYYSDLKKQNLIKDFGSSEVTCSSDEESYVEVRKANDNFLYSTSLVCRDGLKVVYRKEEKAETPCTNEPDKDGPIVTINPKEHDWVQSEDLKIKIRVYDDYTLNKNIGILYYWKDATGAKVSKEYTYNYKNKEGVKSVSYQIPTKNIPTESGEYQLVVRQWISPNTNGIQDILGNERISEEISGIYKIDNEKPTCGDSVGDKTNWTNEAFTISQYCHDDASGCTDDPYTEKFTTSTKTHTFTISDKAGNTNKCKVDVYLDVDKPSCGKITGQSTKWTKDDRTISVECSDTGGSNCTMSPFEQTFTTEGKKDIITIQDVAGNTTDCMVNKYIDRTPPVCPSIESSEDFKTWTKENIDFTFNFSSDTVSWDWYTDSKGSYKFWDNNKVSTKSKTISGEGKRKIMVRVYDEAGNSRDCFTDHEYWIDKTAPTCASNTGSTTWTNKDRTVTVNCSDSGSGCASSSYSETYTTDTKTDSISIKDKAGNSNSCKVDVYLDKTPPAAPKYLKTKLLSTNKASLSNNLCYGKGGGTSDASCSINYDNTTFFFTTSFSITDLGKVQSGIADEQYTWNHNGGGVKCTSWVTDCEPWTATTGGTRATWITYQVRAIDKAGNIGPVFTLKYIYK